MPNTDSTRGEQESFEIIRNRARAWWTTVLAGQVDQSYPVVGSDIKARMDGDTLVVTGTLPTDDDKDELAEELEHLRGNGVKQIRNEVTVKDESPDEKGLLVQTMVSVFENDEQAGFAQGYLEAHAHITRDATRVVAPENAGEGHEVAHTLLPELYWQDADRALDADRTLLIVTVDETDAFRVRQLLDEETRSLETIILPPVPARGGEAERLKAPVGVSSGDAAGVGERSEAGRRTALAQEGKLHGS